MRNQIKEIFMGKIVLTRKTLYDLVWMEPPSYLLGRLNISSSQLEKICQEKNIPLPNEAYWYEQIWGHKVYKTPLPLDFTGNDSVEFSSANIHDLLYDDSLKDLKVPSKLLNPDKLISSAMRSLSKNKKWRYERGLVVTEWGELNIRVAPENVHRALLFMDAFIKVIKNRYHNIEIKDRTTFIVVNDIKIEIALREKLDVERVVDRFVSNVYKPTGLFIFKMGELHRKEWIDTGVKLEDKLGDIIKGIEHRAKLEKEYECQVEEHHRKQREIDLINAEKRKIEEDKEKSIEEEIQRFKELINDANRWNQAQILRSYMKEYEKQMQIHGKIDDVQRDWIEWAKQKIDWYDPFINKEDTLLSEIVKRNLFEDINSGKENVSQSENIW